MGRRLGFGALLLVVLLALQTNAKAVTINFDDVEVGGSFADFDGDRYRDQGIVFDGRVTIADVDVLQRTFHDGVFLRDDGTSPNALLLGPEGTVPLAIGVDFVVPGTSIAGVTDFVEVRVFDGAANAGSIMGTLEAYDAAGMLIDSVAMTTPDGGAGTAYTIIAAGIARISLIDDGDGSFYDNLSFNTPVPEPSTALLLLGGLLAFSVTRRTRAR